VVAAFFFVYFVIIIIIAGRGDVSAVAVVVASSRRHGEASWNRTNSTARKCRWELPYLRAGRRCSGTLYGPLFPLRIDGLSDPGSAQDSRSSLSAITAPCVDSRTRRREEGRREEAATKVQGRKSCYDSGEWRRGIFRLTNIGDVGAQQLPLPTGAGPARRRPTEARHSGQSGRLLRRLAKDPSLASCASLTSIFIERGRSPCAVLPQEPPSSRRARELGGPRLHHEYTCTTGSVSLDKLTR
jgi:hypothetical protein